MKKKILTITALTWLACNPFDNSQGCTFMWDPITLTTVGSPTTIDHYTVYEQEPGKPVTPLNLTSSYAPPNMVSSVYTCKEASYWVTGTSVAGIESAPSNIVIVGQPKSSVNFTIAKP